MIMVCTYKSVNALCGVVLWSLIQKFTSILKNSLRVMLQICVFNFFHAIRLKMYHSTASATTASRGKPFFQPFWSRIGKKYCVFSEQPACSLPLPAVTPLTLEDSSTDISQCLKRQSGLQIHFFTPRVTSNLKWKYIEAFSGVFLSLLFLTDVIYVCNNFSPTFHWPVLPVA